MLVKKSTWVLGGRKLRALQGKSSIYTLAHTLIYPLMILLSRLYVPFLLVGIDNRITKRWSSLFFCYPGNSAYVTSYFFRGTESYFSKWVPVPIGILRQGGKLGLVLATPVTERDFLASRNESKFFLLQSRLQRIARLVGVKTINMAGILPSVLSRQPQALVSDPRPAVVGAISESLDILIAHECRHVAPPIIVLGGNGYVGTAIRRMLSHRNLAHYIVDPKDGLADLPAQLRGRPCILIDVARRGALDKYVEQCWSGLVILNETFPEPAPSLVDQLAKKGVKVFHLAGVEGTIRPTLPYGYEKAVPCCAVHNNEPPLKPKLLKLSP